MRRVHGDQVEGFSVYGLTMQQVKVGLMAGFGKLRKSFNRFYEKPNRRKK